jgi:hypothetical protein
MSAPLYVCFTMDVERIATESPTGGPPSWEFAESSVRAYCEILCDHNHPATLFIVPDTAEKQPRLFQEMQRHGHECGLHFHPQSGRDHYRNPSAHEYLGGYGADEQHAMLGEAKKQWEQALGFAAMTFRPGNFSANDATFRVLDALGFRCGSVSQPGRCAPTVRAVWTGAPRSVHRAHRSFRLVTGDLDFVEVPATVDSTRTDHWTGVGDARIESWDAAAIVRAIEDSIEWQRKNDAPLRHLCLFTHNFVSYGEGGTASGSRREVLRELLAAMPAVAAKHGLEPVGCTLSRLRAEFLAVDGQWQTNRGQKE